MQERSRKEKNILYIVVPCYNEEQVLAETSKRLKEKCEMLIHDGKIAKESRIVFVDDGSKDHTWNMIDEFHKMDSIFSGVKLSRNRGHQNALLAGLTMASEKADIVISMDADLQDDINAVDQMIEKYYEGCDIVYGVRSARDTDTFFKRFTAQSFYKILNWMGVEVVYNHADYRLISGRVLKEFQNFKEVNLYLRGMIPLVGFQSTTVSYERHERLAGESHYPLSKMFALAFDGITSLSIKPIRMIAGLGMTVSFISFLFIVWILIQYFSGHTVQGWASISAIVCLMGGIQLICAGVIGEYIGKIYLETKARPRYIISERTEPADVTESETEDRK